MYWIVPLFLHNFHFEICNWSYLNELVIFIFETGRHFGSHSTSLYINSRKIMGNTSLFKYYPSVLGLSFYDQLILHNYFNLFLNQLDCIGWSMVRIVCVLPKCPVTVILFIVFVSMQKNLKIVCILRIHLIFMDSFKYFYHWEFKKQMVSWPSFPWFTTTVNLSRWLFRWFCKNLIQWKIHINT